MIDLIAINVYGPDGMPETVISTHRTPQGANHAKARAERERDARIKGGDVASKGERYITKWRSAIARGTA